MLQRHQTTLAKLQTRRLKPPASVSIREILVTEESREGNYNNQKLVNETSTDYLTRTLAHITRLAQEAAGIHLADNFDATEDKDNTDYYHQDNQRYQFKPQQRNQVTRLSFNEYYFFPHKLRGPLSEAMFITLCERLEMLATQLPENLHLLLSSFPLRSAGNQVINIVIYVQCGRSPELRTMAKADTRLIDPDYPVLPSWEINVKEYAHAYQATTGSPVNTCIPFVCKTPDAAFWTAIDICLDHFYGFAINALQKQLIWPNRYMTPLPLQATHIVTSNTIALFPKHLITQTVTHVDPKNHAHYVEKGSDRSYPFKATLKDIRDNATSKTSEMRIYPAHVVDVLRDDLIKAVTEYNVELKRVEMKEEPARSGFRV